MVLSLIRVLVTVRNPSMSVLSNYQRGIDKDLDSRFVPSSTLLRVASAMRAVPCAQMLVQRLEHLFTESSIPDYATAFAICWLWRHQQQQSWRQK